MKDLIQEKTKKGISFGEYKVLVESLLKENKTTGNNHSETYLQHTKMGLQRLKKWEKIARLSEQTKTQLDNLKGNYTWLVLVEAWCGDVGQNLSTLYQIAQQANIDLKIVQRDENLDLMDQFLTNGGRSIPKLIIINSDTSEVLGEWGPRPAHAQQRFLEARDNSEIDNLEIQKEIHLWYAKNKQQDLQNEIVQLMLTVDRERSI
ncbi:MAG: thioredoxin family protein [Crocinitomicaceae bacterium]|nr:thioredoxin family protein [Crocinitomicaceae bacterium]|tara:strand:+ start:4975 stop:5589 length:615 start_codon:yes stop_codon:yes gene_type:complete